MTNDNLTDMDDMAGDERMETVGVVQDTLDKFLDSANVYAVYGEPIRNGDLTIIPTAEVVSWMGFGVGYGDAPTTESQHPGEERPRGGSGGGGGGGGSVLSRPVAVIVSSPDGVRVEPVVDVTKIALAAFTAMGFMLSMLLKMRNPKRS